MHWFTHAHHLVVRVVAMVPMVASLSRLGVVVPHGRKAQQR